MKIGYVWLSGSLAGMVHSMIGNHPVAFWLWLLCFVIAVADELLIRYLGAN